MIVLLKNKSGNYNATGDYDVETNSLVVKTGSVVSPDICYTKTFRGAKSVERQRVDNVVDNIVQRDVKFSSPSTAANFVTGRSSNGMIMWKTEEGKSLKKTILK